MPCDPLRDLRAWQERLERLATQHATAWAPPIDVYETEDRYVIVSQEGITADLRDGVLTLTLPKSASAPRTIEIS